MIKTALDESVVELKVMPTACKAIAQEGRHIQGSDKRTATQKLATRSRTPSKQIQNSISNRTTMDVTVRISD
jgi:hypothetical protein